MNATGNPKVLVLATFVAFTLGAVAGYLIRPQLEGGGAEIPEAGEMAPHPVGAQEYVQLGMSSLTAGDFGEAERRFRQALERAPDDPEVRTDLAVALMYQERWDEAWDQVQEAKEDAPEMPEVYFLEGIVLRDARADTAGAREAWSRFLELVPEDSPQAETVRQWLAELEGRVPAGPPASPEESGATEGADPGPPSGD